MYPAHFKSIVGIGANNHKHDYSDEAQHFKTIVDVHILIRFYGYLSLVYPLAFFISLHASEVQMQPIFEDKKLAKVEFFGISVGRKEHETGVFRLCFWIIKKLQSKYRIFGLSRVFNSWKYEVL